MSPRYRELAGAAAKVHLSLILTSAALLAAHTTIGPRSIDKALRELQAIHDAMTRVATHDFQPDVQDWLAHVTPSKLAGRWSFVWQRQANGVNFGQRFSYDGRPFLVTMAGPGTPVAVRFPSAPVDCSSSAAETDHYGGLGAIYRSAQCNRLVANVEELWNVGATKIEVVRPISFTLDCEQLLREGLHCSQQNVEENEQLNEAVLHGDKGSYSLAARVDDGPAVVFSVPVSVTAYRTDALLDIMFRDTPLLKMEGAHRVGDREFAYVFPELSKHLRYLRHLTLEEAEEVLQEQAAASATIDVAGFNVKRSLAAFFGPLVILGLAGVLLMYTGELGREEPESDAIWWALFPQRMAVLFTYASVLVLPLTAMFWDSPGWQLDLPAKALWIGLVLSASALLATFLVKTADLRRLNRHPAVSGSEGTPE